MLIRGDARAIPLRDESVQCVVTSPPYWGLRDYGVPGQLGLEATPAEYVEHLVAVFREVRRVLRSDGVCWLNLGDSYCGAAGGYQGKNGRRASRTFTARIEIEKRGAGLKPKDLVGIPWRVAFALQADGWWLRSDIVWAKPNPMPESVTDRPTRAHEYVFLLAKSERYHYDAEAIREPAKAESLQRYSYAGPDGRINVRGAYHDAAAGVDDHGMQGNARTRNLKAPTDGKANSRSVWQIPAECYDGAHFATFPEALVRRCILAGAAPGTRVLDPFVGSGTTVRVARDLGRRGLGLDLNRSYLHEQATSRIRTTKGMGW